MRSLLVINGVAFLLPVEPQVTHWESESFDLRDQFAGLAMQALLSNEASSASISEDVMLARHGMTREQGTMSQKNFDDEIAKISYEMADAMLRARKRPPRPAGV